MSESCCAFAKPDGQLCAARPLPGRPFCLFHDPDHAQDQTEARSKGGAAPRRRVRRFPRVLDHFHVAELLSELFIDSLNDPLAIDTKRLHALTTLAATLLKAVGTNPKRYLEYEDRREPAATVNHLLRIYPPLTTGVEALLALDPPTAAASTPDPTDPSDPSTQHPTPNTQYPTPDCLTREQALDRSGTGPSAIDNPPHAVSADRPPFLEVPPLPPPPDCLHERPAPEVVHPPVDQAMVTEALAILAEIRPLLRPETAASLALWADRFRTTATVPAADPPLRPGGAQVLVPATGGP